ncbi:MAG: AAA family ATPase, partial [Bariatricus sp.]
MFAGLLFDAIDYGETLGISENVIMDLKMMSRLDQKEVTFRDLSNLISNMCKTAGQPVVLMIDEVDQAGGQPMFLSFLGMLRNKYLKRRQRPTFQSVILTGVYDIKNLKLKLRPEIEHQKNSPWNIAAEFDVDMSFSADDIAGMLREYEADYHTGMDLDEMSERLYDYTSGYPFLVSRLCQLMDEKIMGNDRFPDRSSAWTKEGFLEALKILLAEKNTLFESLTNKLIEYPELREMLYSILFNGDRVSFNHYNPVIDLAYMLGFVKNEHGIMVIANRIFETCLYNLFLSEDELNSRIFAEG